MLVLVSVYGFAIDDDTRQVHTMALFRSNSDIVILGIGLVFAHYGNIGRVAKCTRFNGDSLTFIPALHRRSQLRRGLYPANSRSATPGSNNMQTAVLLM